MVIYFRGAETSKGRSVLPERPFIVRDVVATGAWKASGTGIRRHGVAEAHGLKRFRPVMDAQFRHGMFLER
jgi:hypothetical protein